MTTLDRRAFLERAGSGLFVFFSTGAPWAEAQEPARPGRPSPPTDWNAYLRIGEDGRVTLFVGKVELGQGAMTALPQLLAEELDVPLESVDVVMADTDPDTNPAFAHRNVLVDNNILGTDVGQYSISPILKGINPAGKLVGKLPIVTGPQAVKNHQVCLQHPNVNGVIPV